ncbi:MAG: hypothetical protein PHN74_01265 [Candidatus Pacebacteria bacterium]|nr:hypothetical protein [Candidatus Paceibacterota bacterium]
MNYKLMMLVIMSSFFFALLLMFPMAGAIWLGIGLGIGAAITTSPLYLILILAAYALLSVAIFDGLIYLIIRKSLPKSYKESFTRNG